jgi:dimethylargininase
MTHLIGELSATHRAIVREPASTFRHGLTTANLGVPDYERALKQHQAYCEALERCGLKLVRLQPDVHYPDSTFVEDTVVLVAQCAVLTRSAAASRAGEIAGVARILTQFYSRIEAIEDPGHLDGGDVCEAGDHYFIGISERTNEAGAQQLSRILTTFGHTCKFIDIRGIPGLLHLKSGMASLGDNRLVVTDALASLEEFASYELVRINPDEEYAANCLSINGHVLIAKGCPRFAATLAGLGYRTMELDMSEFRKMDGGLSCLSLRF